MGRVGGLRPVVGYTGRVPDSVAWGTPVARRALAASALGSGVVFLDGTVVNVALPSMGADLDTGLAGLQWVLNGYLVTLTALMLLGGSVGDHYGRRRVFLAGLAGFTTASVLCGLAPTAVTLVAARALQGVAAAFLVPGSLALLSATVAPADRARAVGAWSALTGVASAAGPFLGGWLVDSASWRWIFLLNVPLAVAVAVAARGVPESAGTEDAHPLDYPGAVTAAAGLALLTAGLIGGGGGWSGLPLTSTLAGVALLGLFALVERRSRHPMLPPGLFASAQFTGANLVTLAVYAGLGGAFFLVVVNLQSSLGYSALEAGAALSPVTLLMLGLSAPAGALAQRTGPRLPMMVGPAVVAAGLAGLAQVGPGDRYLAAVAPPVVVFGLGLALTVAPLTAAVLAAVDEAHLGVGSATNNAVARLAGLLAVAVLPNVAGVDLASAGPGLAGYPAALRLAAGLCLAGSLTAAVTIRRSRPTLPTTQASVLMPCHDPSRSPS